MKAARSRRRTSLQLILLVLLSGVAGYIFAITIAKTSAPKKTVYELPHEFTVGDPTFLPSALPGPTMTSGNRLELLENGDAIFPAMLAAISSARKTVNFEAYIFWSGEVGTRFRDALAERAARGVAVRVLLDAVGSSGKSLKASDVEAMRRAGCRVEFFHSKKPWMLWVLNHRNHRRVLVVDGKVGFTGGVGFADPWRGDADSHEHWRDTQVRVEGPAVRGLQRAFQENWSEVTGEAARRRRVLPGSPSGGARSPSPSCPRRRSRRCRARNASTRSRSPRPRRKSGSPTPISCRTSATADLLVAAARRGVDVRIIVPSDEHNDVPATKAAGRGVVRTASRGRRQDLRVPADDVPPEDDGRGRDLLHGRIGQLRRAVVPSERGDQRLRLRRRRSPRS